MQENDDLTASVHNLETSSTVFELNQDTGTWTLRFKSSVRCSIENAAMALHYKVGKSLRRAALAPMRGKPSTIVLPKPLDSKDGIIVESGPTVDDIVTSIEFALLEQPGALVWRMKVENRGHAPAHIERACLMSAGPTRNPLLSHKKSHDSREGDGRKPPKSHIRGFRGEMDDLRVHVNGWQSWSPTGWVSPGDRQDTTRLGPLTSPMQTSAGSQTSRTKGHFVSDMYGVLHHGTRDDGLLAGFLSQRQSFGHVDIVFKGDGVEISLQSNLDSIQLEPAHTFTTDWAYVRYFDTDHSQALRDYFDLVGLINNARTTGRVPFGWCSWYYLFQGVTEEDIEETVEWAIQHRGDVPLDIIQIDDGFQSEVGDWLEINTQFSHGMPRMSAQIRKAGMRPGLWLAPFIAKPNSKVVKKNPGWVLKNQFRLPTNTGLVWNTYGRALDVTHPEVLDYVRDVVGTAVREWGFTYLKLDFLYTGALPGVRYDPGLTRAQSLYRALKLIRDEVGEEVFLVGCGCPLGSGIGIFDSMRIGPDVSPSWYPEYRGLERLLKNERGLPSARNAMISTIVRSPMHRRLWINDPDCLLLRTQDTRLTRDEVQSLATVISFSGGAMLVSDPLPRLSQEKLDWLSSLLPPLEGDFDILPSHSTDLPMVLKRSLHGIAGDWTLIALLNWDDEGREISLDLGSIGLCASERYHALDFWNARYFPLESTQPLTQMIPPHGVRLFSIRTRLEGPQWLGDTLHISQGSGIKTWEVTKGSLRACLDYGRTTHGSAWLSLPGKLRSASVNGRSLSAGMIEPGIIKIDIKSMQDVNLEISWSEATS